MNSALCRAVCCSVSIHPPGPRVGTGGHNCNRPASPQCRHGTRSDPLPWATNSASRAAGSLAAAFPQPVIGRTIECYSHEPVFVAVALMHIVSAMCVMWLVRRIEPVELKSGMPP
jgi:hypothetical protein